MLLAVRRPLLLQAGALGLLALAVGGFGDMGIALAVAYGGAVSVLNTALLWWRWYRGAQDFHCDGGRHLRSFYRSAMERFFVVVIMLAAGFVWIGDHPVALLAGFMFGQAAWIAASLALRERT
ncbi:ATP synthase subunit I [Parasulfuritortus cantonensis]|uniref:ATP synthase subunit I n=1 Tax=Parasulfuritortus cantonensis TaxID=2528202 RepID=A0A4R1B5F6_9PROT|nr:ATP synthase subunit I [Parasulfuritortus cantonensis]TCJ12730.1 ATP synthase subunit I [Parasulfuritortus cantonensis]